MQNIYLNDLSFSCTSQQEAMSFFLESFNEVLIALGELPRACFFHRNESIDEIQLGINISYKDILHLIKDIDIDIYTTLVEFADKSCQELDIQEYISKMKNPSIQDMGSHNPNELDLILLAAGTHSILMSLNTSNIWSISNITIHYYEDEQCSRYQSIDVGNISQKGHGQTWRDNFLPDFLENLPRNLGNYSIKIFAREHGLPHFHLCHRGTKLASINIESFEIIVGSIPNENFAQEVITWAREHQSNLRTYWKNNAQPGFTFYD